MEGHVAGETLGAYAEGKLSPERTAAVEAHVADCADCLAALAAVGAASELARFAAPLSPQTTRRLQGLASATPSRRRRAASGRRAKVIASPWARTASTLVALAAALLVGILLLSHSRPDAGSTTPVAQVSPREPAPAPTPAASQLPQPAPSPSRAPQLPDLGGPGPGSSPAPTPESSPGPVPGTTPEPGPTTPRTPEPATTPEPVPEGQPTPRPSPTTEPPPPWPKPTPGTETAPEPRPVEIEVASGTCSIAKKSVRLGDHATVKPGDEVVASSGARLLLGRRELALRGTVALEATGEGAAARLALDLRSGDLLLSVPPALEGTAEPALEVRAGDLHATPEQNVQGRILCSLVADKATFAALEGGAVVEKAREQRLSLKAGQQVVARKGSLDWKVEAARAAAWARGLAAREEIVYKATFEASADGWDEEVRVSPGFGGSRFGLQAFPSQPGQPWRFLALRTQQALDPAVHTIRFRWRTPVAGDPLEVSVMRVGSREKLVATVKPPADANTWALFEVRLADFARVVEAGDVQGIGSDRKAKIVLQQGTEHDPVPADFVIDDFEIVARGR